MTKRFTFMLDSGVYSVWARSNTNPHRRDLQRRVVEAQKIHGSKKKTAEALGIPYGMALGVTSDFVERMVTLENYAEFVNQHRDLFRSGVWNFDVIGSDKGSYDNWIELRRLGIDAIPVYHIGDDESYLVRYLDNCEFIGIGAIAKMDVNSRLHGLDYVWRKYLRSESGLPRLRVHGLGLTDTQIVLRYPWYSVDSTRSFATAGFGSILVPNVKGNTFEFDDLTPLSVSDQSRRSYLPQGRMISTTSFYTLPQRTQSLLREFAACHGWTISQSLEGRKLQPVGSARKKQDPKWVDGLGIVDTPEIAPASDANNLSSDWRPRCAFNLLMVERFVEYHRARGKMIRIYNVIGGSNGLDHIVSYANSQPVNRVLVSFAKLISVRVKSTVFLNKLESLVHGNGDTKRGVVVGNQTGTAGDDAEGTVRPVEQDRIRGRTSGGIQRCRRDPASPAWRP